MKISLIAPFAVVSLLFAACEQKSAHITSSSPSAASTPSESTLSGPAELPENSEAPRFSLVEASPTAEASAALSESVTSNPRPVFSSEAATQAANQYLDSYNALRNDVNVAPKPPPANLEAGLSELRSYAQKLARETAEFENQKRQVDSQLTPDERKRLQQYQKSLDQAGHDTN